MDSVGNRDIGYEQGRITSGRQTVVQAVSCFPTDFIVNRITQSNSATTHNEKQNTTQAPLYPSSKLTERTLKYTLQYQLNFFLKVFVVFATSALH